MDSFLSDRSKAFDQMSSKLQSLALECEDSLAGSAEAEMLGSWDVGELARKVIVAHDIPGVDLLAKYLGLDTRELMELARMAAAIDRDDLKNNIAPRRMANGEFLTTVHLFLLYCVTKEGDRSGMLERCFRESMSIETLAEILHVRLKGHEGAEESLGPRSESDDEYGDRKKEMLN